MKQIKYSCFVFLLSLVLCAACSNDDVLVLHHPAEPEARFYPAPDANAIEGGIDGRNLLFDRRNFFARHQIEVDYRSDEIDFRSELAPQRDRLPRCRARLARRERLNITVIGDSISEGYNATAFVGSPPFEPPYPELVRRELAERFGTTVELRNRAIGGTGCCQAADIADSWLGDRPDLLIVAYGMNDFAHLSATEFIRIMTRLRDTGPYCVEQKLDTGGYIDSRIPQEAKSK